MTYLDYYVRTTAAHWDEVMSFGVMLGVIQQVENQQGETVVREVGPGCWHYIGPIHTQVGVDEDGFPVMESLKDSEGVELLHANLRTTINLRERALELASESPELAEAMSHLGDYFLLNEAGEARLPSNPHCVFA